MLDHFMGSKENRNAMMMLVTGGSYQVLSVMYLINSRTGNIFVCRMLDSSCGVDAITVREGLKWWYLGKTGAERELTMRHE